MKRKDERYLAELLARTKDEEPPEALAGQIMARLDQRRAGSWRPVWLDRLGDWLFRPRSISCSPARLAATLAVVALAFVGGMQAEHHFAGQRSEANLVESALPAGAITGARANYLIGRGLLAADRVGEAAAYLARAVELAPNNAEYSHWQGVAYWTMGNGELERESYIRSLRENPHFLPSLLNLGHSYLESGNYSAALDSYQRVLEKDPIAPEALYNRALAYQRLHERDREILAFRQYLEVYRMGKWAQRAVHHLHLLGDYGYRTYRIGIARHVLNMEELLGADTSPGKNAEVDYLVRLLQQLGKGELHIVVYTAAGLEEARRSALDLRKRVRERLGPEEDIIIRVSWFDTAETISPAGGVETQLSPSLLLFTRQLTADNRRRET